MNNVIVFRELDGDDVLEKAVPSGLNVGDWVMYEFSRNEYHKCQYFLKQSDVEGRITERVVDLNRCTIMWFVDLDKSYFKHNE